MVGWLNLYKFFCLYQNYWLGSSYIHTNNIAATPSFLFFSLRKNNIITNLILLQLNPKSWLLLSPTLFFVILLFYTWVTKLKYPFTQRDKRQTQTPAGHHYVLGKTSCHPSLILLSTTHLCRKHDFLLLNQLDFISYIDTHVALEHLDVSSFPVKRITLHYLTCCGKWNLFLFLSSISAFHFLILILRLL